MAVQLQPLVATLTDASGTESPYDRWLIRLASLGPLLMVMLTGWQYSLDQWYSSPTDTRLDEFTATLEATAAPWLDTLAENGKQVFLLVDPECPCTRVALDKIQRELARLAGPDQHLAIVSVTDDALRVDRQWQSLLRQVPTTPTLIVADNRQLTYFGPAVTGNFCSATGLNIPTALTENSARGEPALVSLFEEGCFCKTPV